MAPPPPPAPGVEPSCPGLPPPPPTATRKGREALAAHVTVKEAPLPPVPPARVPEPPAPPVSRSVSRQPPGGAT